MPDSEIMAAITAGDAGALERILHDDPRCADARDDRGVSYVMQAMYHRRPALAEQIAEARSALDCFELVALGRADDVARALDAAPGATADRSPDGFTPLHFAAFFDHPAVATVLLARGADPTAIADNPTRVHPLHSAAAAGADEIVALLLDYGAEVDARQQGGWTALMAAAMHGRTAMVERLLAAGATADLESDDGRSAASLARANGHHGLAAALDG